MNSACLCRRLTLIKRQIWVYCLVVIKLINVSSMKYRCCLSRLWRRAGLCVCMISPSISASFSEDLLRSTTYKISRAVFSKCSDLAFVQMIHPREWAQCDISQLSRTPSANAGTRALESRKGSQGKPLKNQLKEEKQRRVSY